MLEKWTVGKIWKFKLENVPDWPRYEPVAAECLHIMITWLSISTVWAFITTLPQHRYPAIHQGHRTSISVECYHMDRTKGEILLSQRPSKIPNILSIIFLLSFILCCLHFIPLVITRARNFGKMPFQMQWSSLKIKSEYLWITSLWLKCYNFILPILSEMPNLWNKCLLLPLFPLFQFIFLNINITALFIMRLRPTQSYACLEL